MTAVAASPWPIPADATRRIFEALLAEPHRVWTVADMATQLPDMSINRLRTTLLLLLGERLADLDLFAPHHRLAVRLKRHGQASLAAFVRGRQTGASSPPAVRTSV